MRQQVLMDSGLAVAHTGVHAASVLSARLNAAAAIVRTRRLVFTAMVGDMVLDRATDGPIQLIQGGSRGSAAHVGLAARPNVLRNTPFELCKTLAVSTRQGSVTSGTAPTRPKLPRVGVDIFAPSPACSLSS